MPVFYNLAYFIFGMFYLPVFFRRVHQAEDPKKMLAERLGFLPGASAVPPVQSAQKLVWIHAVSVGEVMAVKSFLEGFLGRFPDYRILLTTVTPTGQNVAKALETQRLDLSYFPFDFTFSCRRFFKTWKPECVCLVETEIWPNFLMEAGKAGVPVGIINARLSEKSAARYRKARSIFRPLFQRLSFILAQTQDDARRFMELGVNPERIEILGNMKFDNVPCASPEPLEDSALRGRWGFSPQDRIWIAGSTHPGEEIKLIEIFSDLRREYPSLKMVLAPRHIERSPSLAEVIQRRGLSVQLSSAFRSTPSPSPLPLAGGEKKGEGVESFELEDGVPHFDVLLLDQLGILKKLYQLANVVFMGGSLVKRGGQNPIEPASVSKAIVHGPFVFNFQNIYQTFDQEGGALEIQDARELAWVLKRMLADESECLRLGDRAFRIVRQLQGATERHLLWIENFLVTLSQERINDVNVHTKLFSSSGGRG